MNRMRTISAKRCRHAVPRDRESHKSFDSSQQSARVSRNGWQRDCLISLRNQSGRGLLQNPPGRLGIYRLSSMSLFALANHGRFYKVKLSSPAPRKMGRTCVFQPWLLIPFRIRCVFLGNKCFRKIRHGCKPALRNGGRCGALICACQR
jgi:hypothetical protein